MDDTKKKPVTLPENVMVDYAFENMLKKFIHDVKKSGVLEETKARRYYLKPSLKKRLALKSKRKY